MTTASRSLATALSKARVASGLLPTCYTTRRDATQCDLKRIVESLNDEPLTHLMLGHRELFHSNLLAWFFETIPEAADQVFGALTQKAQESEVPRKVMREKDNTDLWLQWSDRLPVLIENKVFSLPDEKQLQAYADKLTEKGKVASLWLLSLSDPNWVDGRTEIGSQEWRWLSYRHLADSIRASLPPHERSYPVETMRHYADVAELLSDLVAHVTVSSPDENVELPEEIKNALGDSRLVSAMMKLRARSVAHYINRSLCASEFGDVDVGSAYTNGTSINEWFRPVACAPYAEAGWQLQGGQFRLALILKHLSGRERLQDRMDFAQENEDLFDFSYFDEAIGTAAIDSRPAQGFNNYNPDFVYRYKKVKDLKVEQLQKAALLIARKLAGYQDP